MLSNRVVWRGMVSRNFVQIVPCFNQHLLQTRRRNKSHCFAAAASGFVLHTLKHDRVRREAVHPPVRERNRPSVHAGNCAPIVNTAFVLHTFFVCA